MSDERLVFEGSPSGARWVEIDWILPAAGRFGRDRRVPRAETTHARISERSGSAEGTRVVSRPEGDV